MSWLLLLHDAPKLADNPFILLVILWVRTSKEGISWAVLPQFSSGLIQMSAGAGILGRFRWVGQHDGSLLWTMDDWRWQLPAGHYAGSMAGGAVCASPVWVVAAGRWAACSATDSHPWGRGCLIPSDFLWHYSLKVVTSHSDSGVWEMEWVVRSF